jgi:polysaccharide deacetylase family protein (PEP-CTERM system associated)
MGRVDHPSSRERELILNCILSIDVEDWFHILDLRSGPSFSDWENLPSRVESNFLRLLDILDEYGTKTTCFFLGWIAERHPSLVRAAQAHGHEIACHGYAHVLVSKASRETFASDAARAKRVLEDISGVEVSGYRAAGFSVLDRNHWFFDELARAGFRYDSSVFPARSSHGGIASAPRHPFMIESSGIREFPVSVAGPAVAPMCFFGGGYLRLFPYRVIAAMGRRVLADGRPVVVYVHPREIDPAQPRLRMPLHRRFRSYVNLRTTEPKLRCLQRDFNCGTFAAYLKQRQPEFDHA